MPSHFRTQLENHLKTIHVEGRVLDIGGSQKALEGRTASWNPRIYKIMDIENRGAEVDYVYDIQKDSSPNFAVRNGDVYFGKHIIPQFDMVFCLEVMEYLYDPVQALRNMAKLCKTGGTLVISFPFIYPLHPPHGSDFLRYTKYGALKLLEINKFQVVKYMPRTFNGIKEWKSLIASEKYKFDREEDEATLNENGCVIVATKI